MLSVLRKLVAIRDIVMRVNASTSRRWPGRRVRTEPPFKLQGSYRNMNRLAEKVVAIMNDEGGPRGGGRALPGRISDPRTTRAEANPSAPVQGTDR